MNLAIAESDLRELNEQVDLARRLDHGTGCVAVSGVKSGSVEVPRFGAVLNTARISCASGVPHLVMLDGTSHPDARLLLKKAGATVVVVDSRTQGGLARPYVIAAQLLQMYAPDALMVKFEGEKPIFTGGRNVAEILRASHQFDIITGERTEATWDSMPPYQAETEYWLGAVIGLILEISGDTPSGILALNGDGRQVFIDGTDQDSWPYLFKTPYQGITGGLRVGTVPIEFPYDPQVVREEIGNPDYDQKRRNQLGLMLDAALELAGSDLSESVQMMVQRLRTFQARLERRAVLQGVG